MSYRSKSEAAEDRADLERMRAALNAARSAMRRDECGLWIICGSHGRVWTWGDGRTWALTVMSGSSRAWTWMKRRLAAYSGLTQVTQDGDDEGVIRVMRLPTPAEAAAIRRAAGLRQSRVAPPTGRRFLPTKGGGSGSSIAQSDQPATPLAGSTCPDISAANPAPEACETADDDGGDP